VLSLLSLLNSDLGSLNSGESTLVKAVINLPPKLRSLPFSLSARKYISETNNRSMIDINRCIEGLNRKGYLVQEYGELGFRSSIDKLITMATTTNSLALEIILSVAQNIKEEPKEELKEKENDKQELGDLNPGGNEDLQPRKASRTRDLFGDRDEDSSGAVQVTEGVLQAPLSLSDAIAQELHLRDPLPSDTESDQYEYPDLSEE
jgi:hypothetical protein